MMNERQLFSLEEIRNHTSETDCWIIILDKVYDATSMLSSHPGGANAILQKAGQDCTKNYHEHSSRARNLMLRQKCIGKVKPEDLKILLKQRSTICRIS
jgi:L-lactate dehydrogenase (cytochrome)